MKIVFADTNKLVIALEYRYDIHVVDRLPEDI